MKYNRINDYIILALIIIIPLTCFILSLLPVDVQGSLMLQTGVWNPLTLFTSIFIHLNQLHLSSNIISFLIISIILYLVNWKAGATSILLKLMLLTIFLIPVVYNIFFNFYATLIIRESFTSCGLSIAVAGLLGLTIPSLRIFLIKPVQDNYILNSFTFSLLMLTLTVISLPRIFDPLCLIIFIGSLALSLIFLSKSRRLLADLFKKDFYSKLIILVTLLTLTVYYTLTYFLFPADIFVFEDVVIDVTAHLAGLLSGIVLGLTAVWDFKNRLNLSLSGK